MRKVIILIILIMIILSAILLLFYVGIFKAEYSETYCSKFSYNACPLNKCKIGNSCPICADAGCHSKDYDEGWWTEE